MCCNIIWLQLVFNCLYMVNLTSLVVSKNLLVIVSSNELTIFTSVTLIFIGTVTSAWSNTISSIQARKSAYSCKYKDMQDINTDINLVYYNNNNIIMYDFHSDSLSTLKCRCIVHCCTAHHSGTLDYMTMVELWVEMWLV